MKRSEMAWIARNTTSVTCSKNLISLEFFGYFLFQDKKYRGFGVQPLEKVQFSLKTKFHTQSNLYLNRKTTAIVPLLAVPTLFLYFAAITINTWHQAFLQF